MKKTLIVPAALAALIGGAALAPAPAAAQSYGQNRSGDDGRYGDRGGRYGDRDMDRHGREQFERGYRQGRDDERRRGEQQRYGSGRGERERDDGWFRGGEERRYGGEQRSGRGSGEREREAGWFGRGGLFD